MADEVGIPSEVLERIMSISKAEDHYIDLKCPSIGDSHSIHF